jgi:hypothetical protein
MSSITALLRAHRDTLASVADHDFVSAHDAFLKDLASLDDAALDGLDAEEEARQRTFFSRSQRRYLAILEREANARMRASLGERRGADPAGLMDDFGRTSYERVRDLVRLVDLNLCGKIVMVGCGAFPATLFWLRRHYPDADYLGLDVDTDCVDAAEALVRELGLGKVRFRLGDGSRHDFSGADFVYVANHVTPKKAVVAQIVRSNSICQIVVREPTRRGALLSETVRWALPPNCIAAGSGGASSRFFSYDMVVERAPATADSR